MKLQDLENYVAERNAEGLSSIDVKMESDAELVNGDYYVIKTKETYIYLDEEAADERINIARQLPGFVGAKKKEKIGKISKKTGEKLSDDTYTVVIELNH